MHRKCSARHYHPWCGDGRPAVPALGVRMSNTPRRSWGGYQVIWREVVAARRVRRDHTRVRRGPDVPTGQLRAHDRRDHRDLAADPRGLPLIQAIGATGERIGLLIGGLLAILIAILLLHHTTTSVAVVGFIVGIFWTIGGIAELLYGFSANDGRVSWAVVVLGVISTIIGILCLVYPSLSLSIICVIVGIGMIFYGVVEILASLAIRRLKDA